MDLQKWAKFFGDRIENRGVAKSHEEEHIQILSYANPIFLPNAKSLAQDLIE